MYIGFYWDLKTSTVSLTITKQENTSFPYRNGTSDLLTPSMMWKEYMGSFYTPIPSSLEGVPILPLSN
jgi:hypothetical protein